MGIDKQIRDISKTLSSEGANYNTGDTKLDDALQHINNMHHEIKQNKLVIQVLSVCLSFTVSLLIIVALDYLIHN
jgi:hypothetical protein